jgi:hypothetical protein
LVAVLEAAQEMQTVVLLLVLAVAVGLVELQSHI